MLLCSKREAFGFSDLKTEEIFDFSLTLQNVSKLLESYCKVTSSTISIQDGENSGQAIPHFHAHIIPRTKDDIQSNDFIYTKLSLFDDE